MIAASTHRNGDMNEVWRVIPGYADYEASDLGGLRWATSHCPVKQTMDWHGYFVAYVRGEPGNRQVLVHRLVMRAFVGVSDLPVDHLDGNKTNNRLDNLQYVTTAENNRRAYKNGQNDPAKHGHGTDKLTDKQRQHALYLYWDKALSYAEVARVFNCKPTAIRCLVLKSPQPEGARTLNASTWLHNDDTSGRNHRAAPERAR